MSTSEERLAEIQAKRRARARRGFLFGLLAGQIVIVGVNLGIPLLLRLAQANVADLPLLICAGILGGVALMGFVIGSLLAISGMVGIFHGGSVWRGLRRAGRAAAALGLTAIFLGGTAFLMIPPEEWSAVPGKAHSMAVDAWNRVRS